MFQTTTLTFACAFGLASAATAQTVTVLAANSNAITPIAGSPGAVTYDQAALAHDGSSVRVNLSTTTFSSLGPWVYRNGAFARYATIDSAGALGPNRQGGESAHVFRTLSNPRDLGGSGPIAFAGKAGSAGSASETLPLAIWRNNGTQNVEVARLGVDDALGPNLGAMWRFGSTGTSHFNINALSNGAVILDTQVLTPAQVARHAVVLHVPDQGNSTCMVQGQTGVLGPNLLDLDAKFLGSIAGYFPAVFDQRVYLNATVEATGFQEGIWRICSGAPAAIALSNTTGTLGPGTSATGTFGQIRSNARPLGPNAVVFTAEYRADNDSSLSYGVFRHQGSNLLFVAEDTAGALGPNYLGAVFTDLNPAFTPFATAGTHLVFETDARKLDNTTIRGLWRVRPGGNPEAIAIEGESGSVAPAPGQTFQRIDRWAVLGNGDVIAECVVNNGPSGIYRFGLDRTPQLIFSAGQSVLVATPQGNATATVTSYGLVPDELGSQGAASSWAGWDSWIGSNGAVLLYTSLNLNGDGVNALLLLQASDPNLLFRDSFE